MDKLKLIALNLVVLILIILSLIFILNHLETPPKKSSLQIPQNDPYAYLTTRNLEDLDPLQPTKQIKPTGKIVEYKLEANATEWEIMPGVVTKAITYNGQVPGPTIDVTEGDLVRITLKNSLDIATSIHWHGMHLPNKEDGVPDITQEPIKPGQTYTYEFLAGHAGTYMYHPHINSVEQIDKGLYGAFIIRPQNPLGDPVYNQEYTFVLGGWNIPSENIDRQKMLEAMNSMEEHGMEETKGHGSMPPGSNQASDREMDMAMGGMDYNFWTINGKAFPATPEIKVNNGDRVRIRLINISNANHPMHLHGTDFRVIAEDGHPLPQPNILNTIDVGPGKIFDIEFLADNPGNWIFHCHELHHTENNGVEPGGLISLIKVGESVPNEDTLKNQEAMKDHDM